MVKKLLLFWVLFCASFHLSANNYRTPGTGVHWDLDSLVLYSGGDVVLSGTDYLVQDTIYISLNDTLSIVTDATVKYASNTYMDVNGVLLIDPPASVIFTAQNSGTGFLGMRIDSSDATILRNFTFEYAVSMRLSDCSPKIDSCVFQYNNNNPSTSFGNGAISLFRASPVINNSQFLNNARAAIQGGSNIANAPKIIGCLFQGNNMTNQNVPQINLGASGTDTTKILNNQILQASTNSGGIGFLPSSNPLYVQITGNLIKNNRYGINLQGGSLINAIVSYNVIDSNNIQNNSNLGGSGIAFAGGTAGNHQNSIVTGNIFRGNLWGITIQNRAKPNLGNLNNADTSDDGKNEFYGNTNTVTPGIDLYNNTVDTIFAQNNFWDTNDPLVAESRIFHQADNSALGIVIYDPILSVSLPVGLQRFTANAEGRRARITWESASGHVERFDLQRSADGHSFDNITSVAAATGDYTSKYSYTDDLSDVYGNSFYYRLKIVAIDGSHNYTEVRKINLKHPVNLSLFPNPTSGSLRVSGSRLKNVRITDISGRVCIQKDVYSDLEILDLSGFARGVYMVRAVFRDGSCLTERLLVK